MARKDEIRRDFRGSMAGLLESFDKGFYKAFDEDNNKIMSQVLHEELQTLIKLQIAQLKDTEIMEEILK